MTEPQTARDYLADHGLAIRGARGKFSLEAHARLKAFIDGGGELSDWNHNGRIKLTPEIKERKPRVMKQPKETVAKAKASIAKPVVDYVAPKAPVIKTTINNVRKENTIHLVYENGEIINQDMCWKGHSVRRCTCSEVLPREFLREGLQSMTLIERQEA